MKLWHWQTRPKPIPGQSRPRGFYLERIPAHEVDVAGKQFPADTGNTTLWLPAALDPIREQLAGLRQVVASLDEQLAGLRRGIAGLGDRLTASPETSRDQDDELAAQAVARALEMAGRLSYARQVLGLYGADRAVLGSLELPPELESWFQRADAGVHRR